MLCNAALSGRKKSVIVRARWSNVYPEDLSCASRNKPAIRDCAVIPLDRDGNAEPCAVLLLSPPHSNDDAAARAPSNPQTLVLPNISACAPGSLGRSRISRARPPASRASVIAGRAAQILSGGQAESVANGALNPLRKLLSRFAQSAAPGNHLEKENSISLPLIASS